MLEDTKELEGENLNVDTPESLKSIHLRKMVSASYDPWACEGSRCPRKVEVGDMYWLDTLSGVMLCELCGNCLKYSRKKALQRGVDIGNITGGV